MAVAGSVVLWVRSGETRAGLYGAAFFGVAVQQGVWMWTSWGTPFTLGVPLVALSVSLVAGVCSVFVVLAAWHTLSERNRMETLHWDSMEAVRELNELANSGSSGPDERMGTLLEIGSTHCGTRCGINCVVCSWVPVLGGMRRAASWAAGVTPPPRASGVRG